MSFGGVEFIDFVEFHIALGLKSMTSIERKLPLEDRLLFNKPYDSIRLLMGETRDRLAEVDWASQRAIVWLDYTDQLSTEILRDVDYVARTARPGSMLIVTINGGVSTVMKDRLPNLKKRLRNLVDPDLTEDDMKLSGATREQKRILAQHVSAACREAHEHSFIQLFDLQYADASLMHTWGGLIVDEETARQSTHCHFEHLDFVRGADELPVQIAVPFLTEKELDYVLKGGVGEIALPRVSGVSVEDVEKFRAIYRYRVGSR